MLRRTLTRVCRMYCSTSAEDADWGQEETLRKYRSPTMMGEVSKQLSRKSTRPGSWTSVPDASSMGYRDALKALDQDALPTAFDAVFDSQGCPHPLQVFTDISNDRKGHKLRDHVICRFLLQVKKLIAIAQRSGDKKLATTELNKAKTLFLTALKTRHMVGSMSNSALIMCCCEAGRMDKAEVTFQKMKGMDLQPSLHAYCSMIKGLCSGRQPNLEKAWEYFQQMVTNTKHTQGQQEQVITSVCMASDSLLIGAGNLRSSEYSEKVWDLVVRNWKIKPTSKMYSSYISALCSCGLRDQAMQVLTEMKHSGLPITSHPYFYIIKALDPDPVSLEQAEQLLDDMHELQIPTTPHIWSAILRLNQQIGDVYGVINAYGRMRRCGVEPSLPIWKILLSACVENTKNPDDAYSRLISGIWHKMRFGILKPVADKNTDPSIPPGMIGSFVKAFEVNRDEDGMKDVADHLRARNVLHLDLYSSSLRQALHRIGSNDLLQKINSEIASTKSSIAQVQKSKRQQQEAALQNSNRPIHAAARKKLHDRGTGNFQ
eukprot:TRINITY_DN20290_c0_g1_i1.p1 TRINITY_DN20290_c0_g1~~TRINITY_DN20290_c0_g1_i1.p1  ORF type:complete len:544 (+),score=70.31 TRINITY_DN20290_c0_g1_i1:68-1699(+)